MFCNWWLGCWAENATTFCFRVCGGGQTQQRLFVEGGKRNNDCVCVWGGGANYNVLFVEMSMIPFGTVSVHMWWFLALHC